MPIYEYLCQDCSHAFELLVRGDQKPQCPSCSSRKVLKQLSVPAAPQASRGAAVCGAKADGSCPMTGCGGGACGFGGPF